MANPADVKSQPIVKMTAQSPMLLTPPNDHSPFPSKVYPIPCEIVPRPPAPVIPDTGLERMCQVDDMTLTTLKPFHQLDTDIDLAQHWKHDEHLYKREDDTPNLNTIQHASSRQLHVGSTFDFSILECLASSVPKSIVERKKREFAFVAPMQLSRPASPKKLPSGDEIWWPTNEIGDIRIHVFICTTMPSSSEKLVRCFKVQDLHGPMIRSSSDSLTETSLPPTTRLAPGSVLPVPGCSIVSGYSRHRTPIPSAFEPASVCTPIPPRRSPTRFPAERISYELATMYLPILGATLTQGVRKVRPRDNVVIPMPYPRAWSETVRYIISGEPDFLSEAVRCNISNLGGRV